MGNKSLKKETLKIRSVNFQGLFDFHKRNYVFRNLRLKLITCGGFFYQDTHFSEKR